MRTELRFAEEGALKQTAWSEQTVAELRAELAKAKAGVLLLLVVPAAADAAR